MAYLDEVVYFLVVVTIRLIGPLLHRNYRIHEVIRLNKLLNHDVPIQLLHIVQDFLRLLVLLGVITQNLEIVERVIVLLIRLLQVFDCNPLGLPDVHHHILLNVLNVYMTE